VVALFQRDASAAGAERAVLVTLGRFSAAPRKAATAATPTVNPIEGDRPYELVQEQQIGIRMVPRVVERWLDRLASSSGVDDAGRHRCQGSSTCGIRNVPVPRQ